MGESSALAAERRGHCPAVASPHSPAAPNAAKTTPEHHVDQKSESSVSNDSTVEENDKLLHDPNSNGSHQDVNHTSQHGHDQQSHLESTAAHSEVDHSPHQANGPFVWHTQSVEQVLQYVRKHMLPTSDQELKNWVSLFHEQCIFTMNHVLLLTREEWETLPMKIGLRVMLERIMGIRHESELILQSAVKMGIERGHQPQPPSAAPPTTSYIESRPYTTTMMNGASMVHGIGCAHISGGPPSWTHPSSTTSAPETHMVAPHPPNPLHTQQDTKLLNRTCTRDTDAEEAKYKLKLEMRIAEELAQRNHHCRYTVLNSMEVHCHECNQVLRMNIRGQARNWSRHCFGVSGKENTHHLQRCRKNSILQQQQLQQHQQQRAPVAWPVNGGPTARIHSPADNGTYKSPSPATAAAEAVSVGDKHYVLSTNDYPPSKRHRQ